MAAKLGLCLVPFLLCFLSFFQAHSTKAPNGIEWWCSKIRYPDTCTQFLNKGHTVKDKSEFKKLVLQIALESAEKALIRTKMLGSKCRNAREKAAWSDCLVLYEDTIHKLIKTLDTTRNFTDVDAQTWLSAGLTNLETCRNGFIELNERDNVLPLMSTNVSELLSNGLAINNASTSHLPESFNESFPDWVSPGDRKLLQSPAPKADFVVAQDGSGNFRTIGAALKAAAAASNNLKGTRRTVIYIKRGVYKEYLTISNPNVMLVGDGLRYTIITGSKSVGGGSTTYGSATVGVTGTRFIAKGITFQNTAGPKKYQAVALRSGADYSVFYLCGFDGYQDTLYVLSQRQFYKECYIYGTVDFVFGNAAVVLQNCMVLAKRPITGQENTFTAQGRTDPNQNTGISFHKSRIMAATDLLAVQASVRSYLGRPWKAYSRTVYLQCYIGSLIDPAGWLPWNGNFALDTLYYGEYGNFGPGSSTARRVKWKGYHVITNPAVASRFTVQNFIGGNSWLPATGVPFTPGL